MECGRFLRLLLASMHDGLDLKQRAALDQVLTPEDPDAKPRHRGAQYALGQQASAEYRRVMSDPNASPARRAEARMVEMGRLARQHGHD